MDRRDKVKNSGRDHRHGILTHLKQRDSKNINPRKIRQTTTITAYRGRHATVYRFRQNIAEQQSGNYQLLQDRKESRLVNNWVKDKYIRARAVRRKHRKLRPVQNEAKCFKHAHLQRVLADHGKG